MDVDGRRYEYPQEDVRPKPSSDVPVLIGANAKVGIARAARHADGFLALFNLSPDELESRLSVAREVLEEEGRDLKSFDVKVFRTMFVHEDGKEAAWEAMKEGYLYERRTYLKWYLETQDSHLDISDDEFEEKVEESKEEWRSWVTCGTPDDIVTELKRVNECWDDEIEVITQLHYTGMDYNMAEDAVDLFGEDIIPRLESA